MDWTKDLSLQLRKLHSQRLTIPAIAEMMNLPEKEVKDKFFNLGLRENEVIQSLPSEFATKQSIPQDRTKSVHQIFTPEMDKEISECLLQRMPNQEIADKLGVTYQQLASRMSTLRRTGRLDVPTNKQSKGMTLNPDFEKAVQDMKAQMNLHHGEKPIKIAVPASVIKCAEALARALQEDFDNLRLEVSDKLAQLKSIEKEHEELILWLGSIEKEPASAATETSSTVRENLLQFNDTTGNEVCQDGK